ncbi:MAG: hydrogenase maturation nickel metallochaperone HypA, partial [Lachnospiraceae bacterium]|nr:hydrogenase maturation nickel metallochaperone HypA [Lachnospiraceae bacterium]
MHELGVVFHIIDDVTKVGEENSLTEVQSVTLQLGTVSTVIPSYLKDCWG